MTIVIQIYTTPSCASCRKAKKWFDQYKIPYSEKNIFSIKLSKDDIFKMLANSENGFEDIISTRSKIFKEKKLDPDIFLILYTNVRLMLCCDLLLQRFGSCLLANMELNHIQS